jgi:hypothetical protein
MPLRALALLLPLPLALPFAAVAQIEQHLWQQHYMILTSSVCFSKLRRTIHYIDDRSDVQL